MKQISRKEAESLFEESKVVSSDVVQDQSELRIILTLQDDRSFVIEYDTKEREKRYFVKD